MMGQLLSIFPTLNIAAVNIHEFPDDLAMWFIINGVRSYVNMMDGMDEFYLGLKAVRDGKRYVSPSVRERILMRREYPMAAGKITDRQEEVIRLICCGFKDIEIADTLHISRRTVDTHKTEIFRSLNVRNAVELIGVALNLEIIRQSELYFYPKYFVTNPKPSKATRGKK
ncbi:MAG: response regulator transcription factor [Treponema sp.]|nr:response regulator transcription factor [Treponema sp.]